MSSISFRDFIKKHQASPLKVIDVREVDEFAHEFIPGSKNIPLAKLEKKDFSEIPKDEKVYLICRSGRRSQLACDLLKTHGYDQVFSVEGGIQACSKDSELVFKQGSHLPIMRQVQIVAGLLIVLGFILSKLIHPYFIFLSVGVGLGLLLAGITGFCGMAILLSKMPWNQRLFCAPKSQIK
ncbi:MAG: rhodanese-like domain-containing protein [Deltaproteobacteria bacterium]|nr:rhodanese-like domain-containing protein [Deltaproteobacteria bacterium]